VNKDKTNAKEFFQSYYLCKTNQILKIMIELTFGISFTLLEFCWLIILVPWELISSPIRVTSVHSWAWPRLFRGKPPWKES